MIIDIILVVCSKEFILHLSLSYGISVCESTFGRAVKIAYDISSL